MLDMLLPEDRSALRNGVHLWRINELGSWSKVVAAAYGFGLGSVGDTRFSPANACCSTSRMHLLSAIHLAFLAQHSPMLATISPPRGLVAILAFFQLQHPPESRQFNTQLVTVAPQGALAAESSYDHRLLKKTSPSHRAPFFTNFHPLHQVVSWPRGRTQALSQATFDLTTPL
jgi:hypothetical protein